MILKKRKKVFLGLICVAVCIVILVVGLWPFSFWPRNEVSWLTDRNGISFDGWGIAYSKDSLNLSRLFQNGSISIEMWLEPDTDANWHGDHWHYAQILSIYDIERGSEALTIGQWITSIELRSAFSGPDKYRKRALDNVLEKDSASFITITSDTKGSRIFIDGELAKVYPGFRLIEEGSEVSGKLIVGNSSTGKIPWAGKIFALDVYNRLLSSEEVSRNYQTRSEEGYPPPSKSGGPFISYRFGELADGLVRNRAGQRHDLVVPTTLRVFQRRRLHTPNRIFSLDKAYLKDVAINVVGFVPLGFFIASFLYISTGLSRYVLYLITMLLGGGISLLIELSQVYLLTRSSSLVDLICNIFGALLGVALCQLALHRTRLFRRGH